MSLLRFEQIKMRLYLNNSQSETDTAQISVKLHRQYLILEAKNQTLGNFFSGSTIESILLRVEQENIYINPLLQCAFCLLKVKQNFLIIESWYIFRKRSVLITVNINSSRTKEMIRNRSDS